MSVQTFDAAWLEYRNRVYPEGMPANQEKELYRAFAAGAVITAQFFDAVANELEEAQAMLAITAFTNSCLSAVTQQIQITKQRN